MLVCRLSFDNPEPGPPQICRFVGRAEALRTSMSLERSRKTQSVSEGAERFLRVECNGTLFWRTKAGEESCSSNDFERLDNGALSAPPPRF